ncbi:MAG: nitrate reductase [Sulfurovum sp. AS07-7]|jgi:nitrate reductase NapD|nr:MAG: nitrate reductase [Sulfurovum sp. AS07-7]
MNISSIVVKTLPIYLDEVLGNIKKCEVCDYHLHDDMGRIIITIEGDGVKEELLKLQVIEAIPNVLSAEMQMSYSEDELDEQIKILNDSSIVPNILQNNITDPSNIPYNGDLKNKDLLSFIDEFDKKKPL